MATSSSSAGAAPFSQAQRQFRFETALGKDTLVVASFTCEEAVSRPYRLLVQLISEDANIPIDKVLRQPATLTVAFPGVVVVPAAVVMIAERPLTTVSTNRESASLIDRFSKDSTTASLLG